MPPRARHHAAESRFRQLIDDADLAPPDDVVYDSASLTFRWHAPQLAVIVDLDDPGDACRTHARSAARAGRGG